MKKDTKVPKEKIVTAENPYLAGRREWNERYGSYIKQASTWRLIALISSGISVMAVLGVIYIGGQSKIKPYIVEVDKLGATLTVGQVNEGVQEQDPRVITAALAATITNMRTIFGNAQTQKKMLFDAYDYILPGSSAEGVINDYFRKNDPFQYIGQLQKTVQIKDVIHLTGDSWQIDWDETTVDAAGITKETATYKGSVQLKFIPSEDVQKIYKNPLGMYISEFNYVKTLNQGN